MSDSQDARALPSRGFAKLDSGIVDSSLWMLDHDALRVWVYLLAKVDALGILRASVPAMAHACRLSLERFEEIMQGFEAPDAYSRSAENEGRRVQRIEGGWVLLNYLRYRELSQRKAGSHAERQARYYKRRKERDDLTGTTVTPDASPVTPDAPTSPVTQKQMQMQMQMQKERKREGSLPLPGPLDSEEFRRAWADWLAYRREAKLKTWKPVTIRAKLEEFSAWGHDRAVAAIRRSIANGWEGIFDRDDSPKAVKASAITSGLSDNDRAALRAMGTRHAGA